MARAFELAITEHGIGLLPGFALVCKDWHTLIKHTPRLWGIIDFSRSTSHVARQLQRAKSAPLSLAFPKNAQGIYSFTHEHRSPIFGLAHNWVKAELCVNQLICVHTRSAFSNLEVLTLSSPCSLSLQEAEAFFGDAQHSHSKIHSFTASDLPSEWIKGFLGPSIYFFRHEGSALVKKKEEIDDTYRHFSRIPNAVTIELDTIMYKAAPVNQIPLIQLPHLRTLSVRNVTFITQVLSSISAPDLQTLSLESTHVTPYYYVWDSHHDTIWSGRLQGPFFTQWISKEHLPINLHTLDLRGNILARDDVPYLTLWLDRLPNLVRLVILADELELSSYPTESNLFELLATPRWDDDTQLERWSLPKLMYLHIETVDHVGGILRVVRSRNDSGKFSLPPARVRFVDGILCCDGACGEWEELQSLVDHVCCFCLDCIFSRTM